MKQGVLLVSPGPKQGWVRGPDKELLEVPEGWALLPPGDAGLTRLVKSGGPCWCMQQKKGRRTFSQGIWAPYERIEAAQAEITARRSTASYQRKLEADRARRGKAQDEYVQDFKSEVLGFLSFPERHHLLAEKMAAAITIHSTPVGSGTVARTKRIPIEQRVQAAVIAWMRHQTTAYDNMHIARVKGRRREVRRALAQRSRELLDRYRNGEDIDPLACPLQRACNKKQTASNKERNETSAQPKKRSPAEHLQPPKNKTTPKPSSSLKKPPQNSALWSPPKSSGPRWKMRSGKTETPLNAPRALTKPPIKIHQPPLQPPTTTNHSANQTEAHTTSFRPPVNKKPTKCEGGGVMSKEREYRVSPKQRDEVKSTALLRNRAHILFTAGLRERDLQRKPPNTNTEKSLEREKQDSENPSQSRGLQRPSTQESHPPFKHKHPTPSSPQAQSPRWKIRRSLQKPTRFYPRFSSPSSSSSSNEENT